jgi:hypothetical protein
MVDPSGLDELTVRASFGHPAVLEHHDLVNMVQAVQVVGDQQGARHQDSSSTVIGFPCVGAAFAR